jgi:hypothetical protein
MCIPFFLILITFLHIHITFFHILFVLYCIILYMIVCFVCFCLIFKLCILIATYVLFCVFCFNVLSCVLFVCKCVLYYCHRVSTKLKLTNTSCHIQLRYKVLSKTGQEPTWKMCTLCDVGSSVIFKCLFHTESGL